MRRQYSQSVNEDSKDPQNQLERTQSQARIDTGESVFNTIVEHRLIKDIFIVETYKEVDKVSIHKKHYVNYRIQVTTDYFNYTVDKRYSMFLQLYEEIHHHLPNVTRFPEKKLFQSNSTKNIAERRDLLQKFLKSALQHLSHKLYPFLRFLNIKDQFTKVGLGVNLRIQEPSKDDLSSLSDLRNIAQQNKYLPANDPERMVMHYMTKLNKRSEERGKIFTKMEKFFFGKMHQITNQFLRYMFIGDEDRNEMGLLQLLNSANSKESSHISCVSGMQFLRKVLDYDYNPLADNACRIFGELTLKQIKLINIETHVVGALQKQCKQDALRVLYKYVEFNQLKPNFVKFLIENQECLEEFQTYSEGQKQMKKEECQFQAMQELDLSTSTNIPTKSTSKEYAQLLEVEASVEQLEEMLHSKKLHSWKQVADYKGHTLWHIQGQFVKSTHPFSTLQQALELMTLRKNEWLFFMYKAELLEKISEEHSIVAETHVWQVKQTYKRVVMFCHVMRVVKENLTLIKLYPLEDHSKYSHEYKDFDISQKYSLIAFQQEANCTLVTVIQNIVDKTFRQAYSPILLKENDFFEQSIDKLTALL